MLSDGTDKADRSVEDVRRDGCFKQFDAICEAHQVEPDELLGKDDDCLVAWVLEQTPEHLRYQGADAGIVRRMLRDFVDAHSSE